jgi:transposase
MHLKKRSSAMDKYRVSLAEEERAALQQLVSVGKAAARKLTHARILLLADAVAGEDCSDDEIVAALGAGSRTIARVRKRFVTEGFQAAIDHTPQPPRSDKIKIKGDIEQQLVRLACSDPPEGRCHWTLQLLADELVVLGLVQSLSTETVRQALKKTTFSLGLSRLGASRPKPMPSTSGGWKT